MSKSLTYVQTGGNTVQSTTYTNWIGSASFPVRKRHGWLVYTALSLLFAGFTGLCAQLRFYLPFTPVPVTGQVFAVLLSGIILGKKYGPLSQVFYLLFGIAGIPWFVLGPIGPTGGYIVGFITAPYIIGELVERARLKHDSDMHIPIPFVTLLSTMLAGVAIIYVLGLIQFSIFTQTGLIRSMKFAVLPFIPFDAAKAVLAAAAARVIIR
jgi:biotin transport system substrate-specific component